MADLYNIPNDNGTDYRLRKFVEYQHEVPEIHYRFTGEWSKRFKFDVNRAIKLCWYLSCTYNEVTAVFLDFIETDMGMTPDNVWTKYGKILSFNSARKYVKNNDQYTVLINEWDKYVGNDPQDWLRSHCTGSPKQNYIRLAKTLRKWRYVGRFASDIFLEGICYMGDYFGVETTEPIVIDWDNGANMTSGLFNIFYQDERAANYEKTKRTSPLEKEMLSDHLFVVQDAIKATYPDQNNSVEAFIGKICSFRNLFKGARYGGFHHDRELGVLRDYEKNLPQYSQIWEECFKLRQEIFPEKLLGELHGWDGIRKERKKLWITKGLTGVEEGS